MGDIDLTDLDRFADGFPHEIFAVHRREAPVFWHEPAANTPDGEGFWSVATHAETLAVLLDPEVYSSETGGDRPYGGTLIQDLPVAGRILNMMDDPRHARIRALLTRGLTPRTIARVEEDARRRVRSLLDEIEDGESFDFLPVAAELPMQMICLLLGVPVEDPSRGPGGGGRDGHFPREATGLTRAGAASQAPRIIAGLCRRARDARQSRFARESFRSSARARRRVPASGWASAAASSASSAAGVATSNTASASQAAKPAT
jgi:cytochrome P450